MNVRTTGDTNTFPAIAANDGVYGAPRKQAMRADFSHFRSSCRYSATTSGASGGMKMTASVTMSEADFLWKNATSVVLPIPTFVARTFCSISDAHGTLWSSFFKVPSTRKPRGMSTGHDHCPGATQLCALGNLLTKGPMNSLCSRPVVGRTTYLTTPRDSTILTHSAVGAIGACTHSPPSARRTTVMRIDTDTLANPCSCSKE
mmetsp:Transcript_51524/g.122702  ORF Transcript_51524/g.122702 Transcript_51524/m.122702 type:complete len:203 (+) Transcript_51524:310-918(+)